MKTIFTLLLFLSSFTFSQSTLVNIKEFIENEDILACESDVFIDTIGLGDQLLKDFRYIFDGVYIDKFYSNGPFGYSEGFDKKLKMFDTDSLEVGTNDIKIEFNEIKSRLEDLEVKHGKIVFKRKINTMNQNETVQIYFENNVNCVNTEKELKEIFSPINCSFDCYPSAVPEMSVNIDFSKILTVDNKTIIFHNQVYNIRLIDLLGNFQDIEYRPEIDINNLQKGVYILQFTFEEEIYTYKFIKE